MFDKLEDLLIRYEELMSELGEPGAADDPARFKRLMKDPVKITQAFRRHAIFQFLIVKLLNMSRITLNQ